MAYESHKWNNLEIFMQVFILGHLANIISRCRHLGIGIYLNKKRAEYLKGRNNAGNFSEVKSVGSGGTKIERGAS